MTRFGKSTSKQGPRVSAERHKPIPIRSPDGHSKADTERRFLHAGFAAIALVGVALGSWVGVQAAGQDKTAAMPPLIVASAPEKALLAEDLPELRMDPITEPFGLATAATDELTGQEIEEPVQVAVFEETIEPDSELSRLAAREPVRREDPTAGGGKAYIALVMDDLGLNRSEARRIANLPARLTLAYLPYANEIAAQTAYAADRNHEIFAHLPMQPSGDEDPGPDALMTYHTKAEIEDILTRSLAEFKGLKGINNHMGSKFTSNQMSMTWLMRQVKERDLLYVDSLTSARSTGLKTAVAHGLPALRRDLFIDHGLKGDLASIENQLQMVEDLARTNGSIIAIGHPYKETIKALEAWVPAAKARGFEFVTISQIAGRSDDTPSLLVNR